MIEKEKSLKPIGKRQKCPSNSFNKLMYRPYTNFSSREVKPLN
jgi:hypothetical protein